MAIDKKYLEEAKQMLMGGYENQKVQLNNSFNQNVQGLEGQKAGVNQNFDNQLQQNAMNTTRSQNQYNNNTLARGLGRSTIATSGQAGIQDQGNRIANQVNDQRTQALGNIESQKTLLQQALQENLLGLQSKQESESLSLAQQLEQQAYDRAFQREQFDYKKQQDALARQLALRSGGSSGRGSSGSGSSGSSGNFNATSAWKYFDQLLKSDISKGTYEAGRFAQQVTKYSPQDAQAMMQAYEQARKKSGSQSKRSSVSNQNSRYQTNY